MTADDISKRLEDAEMEAVLVLPTETMKDRNALHVSGRGSLAAWQNALGPTREQVEEACQDTFAHMTFAGSGAWTGLDPEDGLEFIADLMRRLYP